MSQTTKERQADGAAIRELYAPIAEELAEVEAVMRRRLRSDHAFVNELVGHGYLLGGKRLRPALLLLAGKAVGPLSPTHSALGAVVELVHTASLVHDDVLDEADIRRHLATVNSRWDNEASVLLGDYLFTQSFRLVSSLNTNWASRLVSRATTALCEGELRQKSLRGDFTLTEKEYIEIIEAKTASLCACSCRLGAHYSQASEEQAEALERFGRDLGIAFQIADDVLDVVGDEQTAGKSLGRDLQLQKPTLPLIRTLQLAEEEERSELLSLLQGGADSVRQLLQPFFERYNAIAYAREKACWYGQRACRQIADLPPSPSKNSLEKLSEYVVFRSR